MLKISVRQLSEPCLWCRDGREVAFDFTNECLSVYGVSYHHENQDLLAFAEQLRQLERFRQGSAELVSKSCDSELKLKFARPGGELWFSAKQHIASSPDEEVFSKDVSYFGQVDGEYVGAFLNSLIKAIQDGQPSREADTGAGSTARAEELLESIALRFEQRGYRVSRNTPLPHGPVADICASRKYLSWKRLALVSEHVVVKWVENAGVMDMQRLSDAGFQHGRKVAQAALLRGRLFCYVILPVIVTSNPRPELVEHIAAKPHRRRSLLEFPVVMDLTTGKASYFGTAGTGVDSFSDMRSVVLRLVGGQSV